MPKLLLRIRGLLRMLSLPYSWPDCAVRTVLVIKMCRLASGPAVGKNRIARRPWEPGVVVVGATERPTIGERMQPTFMEEGRLIDAEDAEIVLGVVVRLAVYI